jgi:zinc transport system substrate-binding protein
MKKILVLILSLFTVLTLSACGDDEEYTNVVYTTVYPMQFLLEEIGGNTITVLRVPGSTTHSHEDTITFDAKDQIDMMNADLLFYVGGGVDTYIPNLKETVFDDGVVTLVDVSETVSYVEVCYTDTHDHDGEEVHDEEPVTCDENSMSEDPHFWLDPVRMLQAATLVKDKLIVQYPENSELYNNNFRVLEAALEKLDEDFQEMADLATKPIIATTMLFNYIHVRYEIEYISLTNSVHTEEVDSGTIIDMIDEALFHEVHTIVFEANTNFPAGETFLEQLLLEDPLAEKASMHGLGNLTEDEITSGYNYLSIMYENLEVLEEATK